MGVSIGRFATDGKKSSEGTWVEAGAGLRLLIARIGNPAYKNHLRKLIKPFAYQLRHGSLALAEMEDITRQAMAKHVLLGWENLEDDQGNPIEYSEQKALELLTQYSDFYEMVAEIANDAELFKQDSQDDAAKNSESASAGS